jgi:hypothetical protein
MLLLEQEFLLPPVPGHKDLLAYFAQTIASQLPRCRVPIRFGVTRTDDEGYLCSLGEMTDALPMASSRTSIFEFVRRKIENTSRFNAVLLVPTGIGTEIGGHAGDATPVTRLLAPVCDTLITHPNVVNASDLNEMPENALYVEGSVICRVLMGTAGLQPVRSNRVIVLLNAHQDESFIYVAVNSVSAARSVFGMRCPGTLLMDPPLVMRSQYSSTGVAYGRVEGMASLLELLDKHRHEYDAVAIASTIEVPPDYHRLYFQSGGAMVNPWGGVEAMLTHAISLLCDVPSAHSPMLESQEISDEEPGLVDPRMAAEAISLGFLECVLKGLQRAPRIVSDPEAMRLPGVLTANDVSCLIIPDGVLGLPTLAALEQGIPVIAVRENANLMRNDLSALPWAPGQFIPVANYWEAAGVLCALKAGIAPESVRRPLPTTLINGQPLTGMALSASSGEPAEAGAETLPAIFPSHRHVA